MYFSLLLAYRLWLSETEGRIYHGTLDTPGSGKFPYHVQLGYRTYRQGHLYISVFCGGTLLTLRYNNIIFFQDKLELHIKRSFITAAHCGLLRNFTSQTVTDRRLEHNAEVHVFAGMYDRTIKEHSQQFSRVAVMKYHPAFWNVTSRRPIRIKRKCVFTIFITYGISCSLDKDDLAIGTMIRSFLKTPHVARIDTIYEVKTTDPSYMRTLEVNQQYEMFLAGMGLTNQSLLSGIVFLVIIIFKYYKCFSLA